MRSESARVSHDPVRPCFEGCYHRRLATVTLNSTLDRVVQVPYLSFGQIHDASGIVTSAGGKGLNVARAARALGCEVVVTGLVAGRCGEWIADLATQEGMVERMIRVSRGESRVSTILVDPVGLYQYIPDGTVLQVQGCTIGFAGGGDISDKAYSWLVDLDTGLDILVTHNAPWGLSTGWRGNVQGSERLLRLVETIRPRYHFFGHLHHMIGPVRVTDTTCVGLAQLVAPMRNSTPQIINPGSLGILDTQENTFHFVQDNWLVEFSRQANILGLV